MISFSQSQISEENENVGQACQKSLNVTIVNIITAYAHIQQVLNCSHYLGTLLLLLCNIFHLLVVKNLVAIPIMNGEHGGANLENYKFIRLTQKLKIIT